MTDIPEEAAVALARALRNNGWQKTSHTLGWETSLPTTRERHTREAFVLLEAVIPHLTTERRRH